MSYDKRFLGIEKIIQSYSDSFSAKVYNQENNDYDVLMRLFNISPEIKRENRQYWGRELGKFWERFVVYIFENYRPDLYQPAQKYGLDEPYDLIVGNYAIDTKYRVGSGDSGTLKKFKQYGEKIRELGYTPVFLMVRNDNLPAAMTAIHSGGWMILSGDDAFNFIEELTSINIVDLLESYGNKFWINR